VGEVSESEGVAAQGQDVGAAAPQGAAELGDFLQPADTARRIESISLVIACLPRRRFESA
jgi:hypothetical protein